MPNATIILMTLLTGWLVGLLARAAETLRIDFEQGSEPGQYERLDLGCSICACQDEFT